MSWLVLILRIVLGAIFIVAGGSKVGHADVFAAQIAGFRLLAPAVIAPGVDVGILFIFALGSLAVYGIILGGWSANSNAVSAARCWSSAGVDVFTSRLSSQARTHEAAKTRAPTSTTHMRQTPTGS